MEYVIGLGANVGDCRQSFARAVELLAERAGSVMAHSTWMQNEALVHPDWPVINPGPYLNGVVLLETDFEPLELLSLLFEIEYELGRRRKKELVRWGPRRIDLDIISCGQRVFQCESLLIPHPEMHKREFVLRPMLEVAKDWCHPILGKSVEEMLHGLSRTRNFL